MTIWFVVPAAGIGTRFGGEIPKQYRCIAGRTVMEISLERLLALDPEGVVVALHREDETWRRLPVSSDPRIGTVSGGDTRAASVLAGLESLAGRARGDDWVLVHDVARPCVAGGDIRKLIDTLGDDPVGGILAAPVSDTLKRVVEHSQIQGTEERSHLWAAMTPQMFRYELLCRAFVAARNDGVAPTDESAAVERLGLVPRVVLGRRDNIKITRPEDLVVAGAIIAYQQLENG
ncbi:MAG: 2-C-methyl-D-erythritol 4-phosphate cytidylyltransferase [Porticoccaceae bacterium]